MVRSSTHSHFNDSTMLKRSIEQRIYRAEYGWLFYDQGVTL